MKKQPPHHQISTNPIHQHPNNNNNNQRTASYAYASVEKVKQGCYDTNQRLMIDSGYGDYSMSLFRLKHKRRHVRDLPSAFTPSMRTDMKHIPKYQKQENIVNEHNDEIDKILAQPKETYLDKIRKEKQAMERIRQEENIRNEFMKGQDIEVRQFQEQLSFNYLPVYQAQKWFKIRDNISASLPPIQKPYIYSQLPAILKQKLNKKKKKGFIFVCDAFSKSSDSKLN